MICNVCGMESRGFAIQKRPVKHYCSMECMDMIDKTKNEEEAMVAACKYVGEYCEEQGIRIENCNGYKFEQMVECAINGWTATLRDRTFTEKDIPF